MLLSPLGKFLVVAGVALVVLGVVVSALQRVGIRPGQLPGDLSWRGGNWSVSFPIVTCIVISIVLTIVLNFLARLGK